MRRSVASVSEEEEQRGQVHVKWKAEAREVWRVLVGWKGFVSVVISSFERDYCETGEFWVSLSESKINE